MKYYRLFITALLFFACNLPDKQPEKLTAFGASVLTKDVIVGTDTIHMAGTVYTKEIIYDTTWVVTSVSKNCGTTPIPPIPPQPVDSNFNFSSLTKTAPVTYQNKSNFVIENLSFNTLTSGNHDLALVSCSNVTIRNCYFGVSKNNGVSIQSCTNVTIQNCFFANNKIGVAAQSSSGVIVKNNQFLNVHPDHSLSIIGGNFIQFNTVTGTNEVSNNRIEAIVGETTVEDMVSMYKTSGVNILNNQINGNGTTTASGYMIQTGDGGGGNITIVANKLYHPISGGISVSGGSNFTVQNNLIEMNPTTTTFPSGVNYPTALFTQGACSTVIMKNNTIGRASTSGGPSNGVANNGCTNVTNTPNTLVPSGTAYTPGSPFLSISQADYTAIRGQAHVYN